jgi:hypothetical protein
MLKTGLLTLASISALSLTGCAFKSRTTGMAVEYNDFVAQTTNRQTLLNVLRAREREPMHFTSFAVVRGTVRGQGTAELSATLAADTAQTVVKSITKGAERTDENTQTDNANGLSPTARASLQVTTGTDFDIAVNATDDFYRGILGPLKESVVVHFLRQGFPADLLSHLTIGELRFYAVFKKKVGNEWKDINQKGEVLQTGQEKYGHTLVAVIRNTPYDPSEARAFEEALRCRQLTYVIDRRDKRSIGFHSISDLSSVAPELLARVKGEPDGSTYSYNISDGTDFRLALSEQRDCKDAVVTLVKHATPRIADFAKDLKDSGVTLAPETPPDPNSPLALARQSPLKSLRMSSVHDDTSPSEGIAWTGNTEFEAKDFFQPLLKKHRIPADYTADLVIETTLRSVEGILYYLGEYVRKPGVSPKLYGPPCQAGVAAAPCVPILVVTGKGDAPGPILADVSYRGRRYAVPLSGAEINREAGRSSQTISLVQQLLNLHRSSKDLPVTPVVRVAN